MAKWSNLLFFSNSPERSILRMLEQFEKQKTPLQVEVENTNVRFPSTISIKRGQVVVAKPAGVQRELEREGFVRLIPPGAPDKVLRMRVSVPHFNLSSGGAVFLCAIPKQFNSQGQRGNARYNTSRFNNVFLLLPSLKARFRIIDISQEGCKIFFDKKMLSPQVSLGISINPASITIGENMRIGLNAVTPRSRLSNTMGFEFRLDKDISSATHLNHFIGSLKTAESNRLKG